MNGFVNTLLSLTLSWIRALINSIWAMLTSEDGGSLYQFLRASWLPLVIILCVGCVLVDGVVYFFRWRPDYLWASRLRRLRRGKHRPAEGEPETPDLPRQETDAFPAMAYAPLQTASAYAPPAQAAQLWQPVQELNDPVFDDAALWENEEPMDLDWQPDEQPAFGAPQPEPLAYFRDVQAGFAPAVPPEKLYTPSASYQPEAKWEEPAVHPGLDDETFRQTVGLDKPISPTPSVIHAPAFRPFTVTSEPEPAKPQGAFQRFAQKARGLIAMDDEQKTIHDLHSSVDVSEAFHEPVYPQPYQQNEE